MDIQFQFQDIINIANVVNNQLANIETIILQTREKHKIQIGKDIYNIFEESCNLIHRNMDRQAYHIQVLLVDELNQCKEREVKIVDKYIKILQKELIWTIYLKRYLK